MARANQSNLAAGTAGALSGMLAGAWASAGFVILIARGLVGMSQTIHETLLMPLSGLELAAYGAATLVFGVAKGYYVFHRRFCPGYVARVRELCLEMPGARYAVLAPLYCLNLIGTDRSKLVRGYALATGIVLMVFTTRLLPLPWRGMIVTGVAAALTWAALEIAYLGLREVVGARKAALHQTRTAAFE